MRKNGKTYKILQTITEEEKNRIGSQIESLIATTMKYIVSKYIYKYREAVYQTFGWDEDDLLQYIREQLWKGAATFDTTKNFKIETYLSSILEKQFINLSKKCQTNKHSLSKLYCPEELFDTDETIIDDTPEDWLQYARTFKALHESLDEKETKILAVYLSYGESATKIAKRTGFKKVEVIIILKELKERLTLSFGGTR